MLSRKYKEHFGYLDRINLRASIISQAQDFGIYQLFKNWFEVRYNKSGDTGFKQSFNKQFRNLVDDGFIEEITYKGIKQVVPKRDYFKERLDYWEVTPDRFYQFSFNNIASFYKLLDGKYDDEDDILMRMRTFFSTIENNFI